MSAKASAEHANNAFRRSFLEHARNMAAVAAYTFAASYLQHKHYAGPTEATIDWMASIVLTTVALVSAFFSAEMFLLATHTRFPNIRHVGWLAWFASSITALAAMAPAYLVYFRDH